MEQRNGIGTAGNASHNTRTSRNESFLLNGRFDFFDEVHTR